ncbi:SAM-dependent methyltransferase [Nocardioides aromaticivorans]|uniref:SAM-dependent methyltransferase n=1 Tax=Nocardioides aromaticivorans TaxID=200618 RepID=A0ABX7PHN9_9ACTN|nr:mycofactocin oligosaccharide methyltransferase MftM [Nocardioides aromaticivorans]QSR25238.1 SAM-dependent methyltransferase [Nocardioides aromaticivorans]
MSAAQIQPLEAPCDGVYRDELVEVRAQAGATPRLDLHTVRTPHFDLTAVGHRAVVVHRVPPERIDDDLSGLLADELFQPGWLRGGELFEHLFTGIVLSSHPDPVVAWEGFYRRTLDRVGDAIDGPSAGAHGTIADYAPVYARVEELLAEGTVLELGCCFGFLALRLAQAGLQVTASDISPGTVDLLAAVAPRLGVPLATRVDDAARVHAPDRSVDNVLAIHLLEHLDAAHGARVLAEALRLARRRVVVAVPLEDEADATWGHVRTISLTDLDAWGRATGLPYRVDDHHGGWLVVDVEDPVGARATGAPRVLRKPPTLPKDPA